MLPFENLVDDYVDETNNHVLYRVTPIYEGDNLVASGAIMEGYSVEDEGDGVCFCVYVYNVQPGIVIDYATGESRLATDEPTTPTTPGTTTGEEHTYVLNTKTKKFHLPTCGSAKSITEGNKQDYTGTREALIGQGYQACGVCKP